MLKSICVLSLVLPTFTGAVLAEDQNADLSASGLYVPPGTAKQPKAGDLYVEPPQPKFMPVDTETWVNKAAILIDEKSSDTDKQVFIQGLIKEPEKKEWYGAVFACGLDAQVYRKPEQRLAALAALKVTHPTHFTVSRKLADATIFDPAADVRRAAVNLIKERKDDHATGMILGRLLPMFDAAGNAANPEYKDNAVAALKSINDRRVYETLLYHCMLEMRPTVTELSEFTTRTIHSYSVNQGANVAVLVFLSFPIQFPTIQIIKVRTTVSAPASALKALSGQDFGDDGNAWLDWIRKH